MDADKTSSAGGGEIDATEVRVLCSGAFRPAFLSLVPGFEGASGHKVLTAWGSSIAGSPTSIPGRLQRGEPVDLVIMAGEGLDRLIGEGRIVAGSRVDLARSGIGVAVRAGAPRPDIGSAAALILAITQAKSIAHSSSASGIYLKGLFRRLGLTDALGDRIRQVEGEPVGSVVARGEAEIGFQQVSELLPVAGIDFVGPLPPEMQQLTVFAAGIAAGAREADAARALVAYLTAPAAAPIIRQSGMEAC
jgi:molybdate transport system substrate-binding protein